MSDDWKPGDLALRVRVVKLHHEIRTGVRQGGIYLVVGVVLADTGEIGLRLEGCNFGGKLKAVHTRGFRKIEPHTPDAEDAETIRLLNSKPVVIA